MPMGGGLCAGLSAGLRDRMQLHRRRFLLEWRIEWPLLRARWRQILCGGVFQYVHAMSTQLAHRMHRPAPEPLHDVGFAALPELGERNAWVSETIFWCMFLPFLGWTFSPFWTARKRFYTAVIYARLLVVLSLCQALRIVSFTVTQLPAPNYHCRSAAADTAVRAPARHWWDHVVVDLGRQSTHGCGDLVFSSHTTFVLVGVLTYTEYGSRPLLKVLAWAGAAAMSLCIVASRKHYSVDVVVAWYVVPLVFYTAVRRWTTKRPAADAWPHRAAAAPPAGGGDDAGEGLLQAAAAELSAALAMPDSGAPGGGGGGAGGGGAGGDGKPPLLPLFTAGTAANGGAAGGAPGGAAHARAGSRAAVELARVGSRSSLAALAARDKEPSSPPAGAAGADGAARAVGGPPRKYGVEVRPRAQGGGEQRHARQASGAERDVEAQPLLYGGGGPGGGGGGSPAGGGPCRVM